MLPQMLWEIIQWNRCVLPVAMAGYNLAGMILNSYYGNSTTVYTTAGELPSDH